MKKSKTLYPTRINHIDNVAQIAIHYQNEELIDLPKEFTDTLAKLRKLVEGKY